MAYLYVYPPVRYETTGIRESFPETHLPLEHTRHQIGHAFRDFVHPYEQAIRTPHADVRETKTKYYVDIELPGLSKENFTLKWTNSKTLLLEAEIKMPALPEEVELKEAADAQDKKPAEHNGSTKTKENANPDHPVHVLTRERRIGAFARAFHFAIDLDHDQVEATLQHGLLRLVLQKPASEHKEPKIVNVQQIESHLLV